MKSRYKGVQEGEDLVLKNGQILKTIEQAVVEERKRIGEWLDKNMFRIFVLPEVSDEEVQVIRDAIARLKADFNKAQAELKTFYEGQLEKAKADSQARVEGIIRALESSTSYQSPDRIEFAVKTKEWQALKSKEGAK